MFSKILPILLTLCVGYAADRSAEGNFSIRFSQERVSLFNHNEVTEMFLTQRTRTPLQNIREIKKYHVLANPLLQEPEKAIMTRLRNMVLRPSFVVDDSFIFNIHLCYASYVCFLQDRKAYKNPVARAAIQLQFYFVCNICDLLAQKDPAIFSRNLRTIGSSDPIRLIRYTHNGERGYFFGVLPARPEFTSNDTMFHVSHEGRLSSMVVLMGMDGLVESSGVYIDLGNANGKILGVYDAQYKKAFCFPKEIRIPEIDFIVNLSQQEKALLRFCLELFARKFGDIQRFGIHFGETLFIPFPITESEQAEIFYIADLLEAEDLLNAFSEEDEKDFQEDARAARTAAQEAERDSRLERARAKLEELNRRYEATTETLIATIEGKLLSLHEADYERAIQEEHAKLRAELKKRSEPGILKSQSNSFRTIKAVRRACVQEMLGNSYHIERRARSDFLRKIKGRYQDRRVVLSAFHRCLAEHGIDFHESRDGSHRTTHVGGARSVTVVEAHRGTRPLRSEVIRIMGDVLASVVRKQGSYVEVIDDL